MGTNESAARLRAYTAAADDLHHFDEDRFPPIGKYLRRYERDVPTGYQRQHALRVVIAGLARNIESVLPTTMARIEHQGSLFGDYRVVIYENDSTDATPELLREWSQRNPRVLAICEQCDDPVNLPNRCLNRATRMARYRSKCQQVIAQHFRDYDAVILVDTDLHGGWSYDGMAHTFAQTEWDFAGANGLIFRRHLLRPNGLLQYDAWAFRDDSDFTPRTTKHVNYLQYRRGEEMVPVFSCFGGIGVYRMAAYLAGRYSGEDVEHVTFHQSLHEEGFTNTFLNPSLIAVYGRKHRTLDRYASVVIRGIDAVSGRPATVWHYGQEDVDQRRAA